MGRTVSNYGIRRIPSGSINTNDHQILIFAVLKGSYGKQIFG